MASASGTEPGSLSNTPSLQRVNLHNSLGAAFIGLIFASILYGVTNVQSLIYYQNSAHDTKFMKGTIAFLWSLDTLHLALLSHALYFYIVTNFTNLGVITETTWSLCLHVLVTTLSDFIVRLFYAWRVWIVSSRNPFLTFGVLALTSVTFVSGIGFGIKIFSYSSTLRFTELSWVLYLSLGSAVAADVWVASSLCFFLVRNKTGFRSTDTVVNVLIIYIINTGLLTSLCATACFVSFAAMSHNYIFMAFYFCLPKLYFNALLAMLNARERLREGLVANNDRSVMGGRAYGLSHILTIGSPVHFQEAMSSGTVSIVTPGSNKDYDTRNRANSRNSSVRESSQCTDESFRNQYDPSL